ncbi:MAG: CapA family protein [Candidatus Hydrogenedentes bacterium]|nr:CapA family protein [Candidatus Hydrogenedentota bacterium]
MLDTTTSREIVKALLAEGALALALLYGMRLRHQIPSGKMLFRVVLGVVALVSTMAYFEFGYLRYGQYMNPHDFYHYYIGTKYAPEVGYHNQYAASLVADFEGKKLFDPKQRIRNLETHGYTPVAQVLAQKDAIKAHFSPERWEDFKRDITWFQGRVPKAKWQQMLQDKGYNGTPVWTMVAGFLTNRISTGNDWGMRFLVAVDPILLAIMFAGIWWAFGLEVMLLAVCFFGTNFVMSFVHIKGALMRMDWVLGLVLGLCLLKKERYKSAGAVLAYSASARIFPLVFVFGLGAKGLWELYETRKVNRNYFQFFAVFAAVGLALVSLTFLDHGTELFQEYQSKIGVHNNDISTTRVGFKYIYLWPYESFGAKVEAFKAKSAGWYLLQLAMLAITFAAARRMKPWETIALGFVPAFFLTAPTFYYYVLLIVPMMLFLGHLEKPWYAAGAALFFSYSVFTYVLHLKLALDFPLCFYLSCMYLVFCGALVSPGLVTDGVLLRVQSLSRKPALFYAIAAGALVLLLFRIGAAFLAEDAPAEDPATRQAVTRKAPAQERDTDRDNEPDGPMETVGDGAPEVPAAPVSSVKVTVPPAKEGISLMLVGDIMLSRNVAKSVKENGRDFTYPFAETAEILTQAEIAFGNLECPISGRGAAINNKKYLFNAPPESIEGITHSGFDLVSLANNHVLDYGPIALQDTVEILQKNAIGVLGVVTRNAPQKPVILTPNGIRVAFLAYADHKTPYAYAKEFDAFETGPAKAVDEDIARDIAALKGQCDVIVVSLHWGIEYNANPDGRQQQLGRFLIDQGVSVVAGHHPHVLQEAEWYKNGLIIYSMGNFVFDQWSRPPTRISRIYRLTLNKGGLVDGDYLPLEIAQNAWQPRPAQDRFVPIPRAAASATPVAVPPTPQAAETASE